MWLLVIILFVLTCFYSKMQYKKIISFIEDLNDDVNCRLEKLELNNDDLGSNE